MTGVALAGAVAGAGLLLLAEALRRRTPSTAAALGRLDRARRRRRRDAELAAQTRPAGGAARELPLPVLRLGADLAEVLARRGLTLERVRADLAVTGGSLEALLGVCVVAAVGGVLLPVAAAVALGAAGGVTGPPVPAAVAGLAGGAVAALVPVARLRGAAVRRRHDVRHATGALLDLVALHLAAGRDVATALASAVSVSDSSAMRLLGAALASASARGLTPWSALGVLGEETGVDELVAAAGALGLVPDDPERVRETAAARAADLRRRELTELGGEPSRERAQATLAAQVLLATGFLVFLLYPAVAVLFTSEAL